jgi:hypothetical protein
MLSDVRNYYGLARDFAPAGSREISTNGTLPAKAKGHWPTAELQGAETHPDVGGTG